jgi:hypothetical protein
MDDADMTALGLKDPETKRVTENNLTLFQAIQVNRLIDSEPIWRELSCIEIRNKEPRIMAAAQVNYPISQTIFYGTLADYWIRYIILAILLYLLATWLYYLLYKGGFPAGD